MKVLVVGSSGQLGREFRRIFELGEPGPDTGASLDFCREMLTEVEYANRNSFDISDADSVASFFEKRSFDLVINCAAETNVEQCEEEQLLAHSVNALGPSHLARECFRQDAKFVHVSTDYVFSGFGKRAYCEDDPTNPINSYGRSKLDGKRSVLSECPRSFVVRTAWLYGYQGGNFVRTILRKAREEGKVGVVADQWGSPTNARDLAFAILRMVQTDEFGLYHVVNKGVCSWFEFACAICDEAGIVCERVPLRTADYPTKARRPRYAPLDPRRFEQTFNFEMRGWREALRSFVIDLERTEG